MTEQQNFQHGDQAKGIPDDMLARAVEAAAKAGWEQTFPGEWKSRSEQTLPEQRDYRDSIRPIVVAALAEVMPSAQAAAFVKGYDAAAKQHPTTTFLGARNPYRKETT